MCYGSCPAYSLSIYADGVVEYSGEHFVKVKGPSTARIPPGRIDELDRLFAEARYFELDSDYTRECSTDSATVDTSYTHHNQFKRISHYEGACNVPPALETLYSGIDRVVGVERWIGTEAEREEHSYGRD